MLSLIREGTILFRDSPKKLSYCQTFKPSVYSSQETSMHIEKIKQKTVVEQVMEKIKDLIVSDQYHPGDKLPTEQKLAEMFGIGRSSIREAIKIFNYLGVLESKAAKGTFLSESANISSEALSWSILLGKDEMDSLIHTRGALELWSMINLTTLYGEEKEKVEPFIEQLEGEIEKMRRGLENKSNVELTEADYNFHSIIINSNNNEIFTTIYRTLKSFMYKEIEKAHEGFENQENLVRDHEVIVDAIKTGDEVKAMKAFHTHIENTKNLIANRIN